MASSDYVTAAADQQRAEEEHQRQEANRERLERNVRAWSECGGYETSSGCPCWDATPYVCIPKHAFGYNPSEY